MAGKHEGWPAGLEPSLFSVRANSHNLISEVILTGHTRLMKAVRDLGMRLSKGEKNKELVLECQVTFRS
jgi:hypothetical protein